MNYNVVIMIILNICGNRVKYICEREFMFYIHILILIFRNEVVL